MTERLPVYGGQAILEGVMMRGRTTMAMAVRAPNGEVVVRSEPLSGLYSGHLNKIPFLRGLLGLWDALGLGMRALTFSAQVTSGEDETLEGPAMAGTVAVSLLLAVGLFFVAPALLAKGAEAWWGVGAQWGNVLEGLVRLALIVGYVWGIGFVPDIRRVYRYHGAEHKTINAFEAGAPLTPDSVKRYPLEHPRCGTAFLLSVVVISILLFSLIGPLPLALRLLSRVLLIPVIAGLAFEYIRFTARHLHNPLVRLVVAPNLALQRLTTAEPDSDMIRVAIAAFDAMRERGG